MCNFFLQKPFYFQCKSLREHHHKFRMGQALEFFQNRLRIGDRVPSMIMIQSSFPNSRI